MSQLVNSLVEDYICIDDFVVFDIETTGLRYTKDSIIEIAAIKYHCFEPIETFETLVNPQIPIPNTITRITGITQEDVDNAPTIESIQDDFLRFIGDLPLVGHNIFDFDIRFVEYAMRYPITNPIIDTLHLSRRVLPNMPNYRLATLKDILKIDVQQSHRALADVKTTFGLFMCCLYAMDHSSCPEVANPGSFEEKYNKREPPQSKYKKVDKKAITPTCECLDANSPLYGKSIVFTGTLSMPREEAMQLAVNAGAVLKSGVSKKTDFLVVGQQDISVVGANGMSSKEEKAHELNNSGKANIKIISEEEFLALLNKESVTT